MARLFRAPYPILAAAVVVFDLLPAQTFENLGAGYQNLRGINYVPTYPSLNGSIGHQTPYYGVASPTAMWKFYDENGATAAEVAQQLDWAKLTGFNAVRVFLSFPAWIHYRDNPPPGVTGNAFINRFEHFVSVCHSKGIYVMPVLWDGVAVHISEATQPCSIHPDYTDPIGDIPANQSPGNVSNISYWHRNPGAPKMQEILTLDLPFEDTDAGQYIAECISVFHNPNPQLNYSAALLMWDVMNEARCGPNVEWVSKSLDAIELFAPSDTTTWGWVISDRFPDSLVMAAHSNNDVLSLHSYEYRIGAVESLLYDATFPTGLTTYPTPYGKPVIFTEIGYPGIGYSYQDAIQYCASVPRSGAPVSQGVGFMPWAFMIGFKDNQTGIEDNHVFKYGTGLFYGDGQVREQSAVAAFVQHAANQGIQAGLWGQTGQPALPAEKLPSDRYYVDPGANGNIPPDFDDEQTQDYWMTNQWMYLIQGVWTWGDYEFLSDLLRKLVANGTWPLYVPSTQNGNPYTWPGSTLPGYVNYVPPPPSQLWDHYLASIPGTPEWQTMLTGLEQQYPQYAPLQPWVPPPLNPNQQVHVDILVQGFLWPFAQTAGQFLVPR